MDFGVCQYAVEMLNQIPEDARNTTAIEIFIVKRGTRLSLNILITGLKI